MEKLFSTSLRNCKRLNERVVREREREEFTTSKTNYSNIKNNCNKPNTFLRLRSNLLKNSSNTHNPSTTAHHRARETAHSQLQELVPLDK